MKKRIGMMILMVVAGVVAVAPVQARERNEHRDSYAVRDVREVHYRRDCDNHGRSEHRRDRDDWYRR